MSLHIIHTVASIENMASGPSYSVIGLARAQAELGGHIEVWSTASDAQTREMGYRDRRFTRDLVYMTGLSRLCFSTTMHTALQNEAPGVVHTHGLWTMPNIYRNRDALIVIAPRGMLSPVALSFSPRRKRVFRWLFQNRALAAAGLFHATADSEYEDIRRFGLSQPVAIIPNGIDIPKLPVPPPKAGRRTVLSLGRIHPKKALDKLIHAWAGLEADFPDWDLLIVGPDQGNHASELLALADELGVANMTIRPPVFGHDKQTVMAAADIFALPSLSENFGMTVAESLAVGVPVVSTKGAPWAGLETERCGRWVDHGVDAMTAALTELMSMPDERRRLMGARGRDWMARDFSWDRMAQLSLEAYAWSLRQQEKPDHVRTE